MTALIKGLVIAVCGIIPAGTLFLLVSKSDKQGELKSAVMIAEQYQAPDIAEVDSLTTKEMQVAENVNPALLVDEQTPIQAITQRDTLGSMGLLDAIELTAVPKDSITISIVEHRSMQGYLFEYDRDNIAILVLMPPDTALYPNMDEAVTISGLSKELILLSISEGKTVDGTKFEYAK